jgi:hypothetical protein
MFCTWGKKATQKGTCRLDKATHHMGHLFAEALEIHLQPNNYNSDGVSCIGITLLITAEGGGAKSTMGVRNFNLRRSQFTDRRGAYTILEGRTEGRRPLERPRHRWENNITMDHQEVGWGGMDWIELS